MEQEIAILKEQVKSNARDILELKTKVEANEKVLNDIDKSLSVTIQQIANIAEDLKTTSINFKEAVNRSNVANSKEMEVLREKYNQLEKKFEKLDSKLEQETVVKDAEKWKKTIGYIATAVLGAIVTFTLAKIGLS